MTAAPLHVAVINGKPLRFFRTPLDDGRPDFPWHAIDDLYQCVGLNRELRKHFLRAFKTGTFQEKNYRTIATPGGTTIIATHGAAQGFIDATVYMKVLTPAACEAMKTEYASAAADAVKKVIPADLEFPGDGWLEWMKEAAHRWDAP